LQNIIQRTVGLYVTVYYVDMKIKMAHLSHTATQVQQDLATAGDERNANIYRLNAN